VYNTVIVEDLEVTMNQDGSLSFRESNGIYDVTIIGDGIQFNGEDLVAYAGGQSYTGSEVLLTWLQGTIYDVTVDSIEVGRADLGIYGEPLIALGNKVVFANEDGRLLLGKDIMITFENWVLGVCTMSNSQQANENLDQGLNNQDNTLQGQQQNEWQTQQQAGAQNDETTRTGTRASQLGTATTASRNGTRTQQQTQANSQLGQQGPSGTKASQLGTAATASRTGTRTQQQTQQQAGQQTQQGGMGTKAGAQKDSKFGLQQDFQQQTQQQAGQQQNEWQTQQGPTGNKVQQTQQQTQANSQLGQQDPSGTKASQLGTTATASRTGTRTQQQTQGRRGVSGVTGSVVGEIDSNWNILDFLLFWN
jgi:hypothetical protein